MSVWEVKAYAAFGKAAMALQVCTGDVLASWAALGAALKTVTPEPGLHTVPDKRMCDYY